MHELWLELKFIHPVTESHRVKIRRFWPFHRVTFGSPDE
jgi:hypothetical protein